MFGALSNRRTRGWPLVLLAVTAVLLTPTGDRLRSDVAHAQSAQPDLIIEQIFDAQSFFDCITPAGVKVVVRNVGTAPAGSSTTSVSVASGGSEDVPTPALAPGEAVTLLSVVVGIPFGDTYTAVADSNDDVAESDETNNSLAIFLSLATLPTCTPTPTSTPANLPDLVVSDMRIELETGDACNFTSTTLGVRVLIANIGSGDAGSFVVDVNGSQQTVSSGLAHGETLSLWFAGYAFGKNTAFVDATFQVQESDEGNNQVSQLLPVPTLPLPCTATPTRTPTLPPSVGGISVLPDTGALPVEASEPSGDNAGRMAMATLIAAIAASAIVLGGAAWYAKRRWFRR